MLPTVYQSEERVWVRRIGGNFGRKSFRPLDCLIYRGLCENKGPANINRLIVRLIRQQPPGTLFVPEIVGDRQFRKWVTGNATDVLL